MNPDTTTTTEIPRVPPQPTKIPRQPMAPETRSWLYGTVAVEVLFVALIWGVAFLMTNSDTIHDKEKSEQVVACSKIQEPNAAFLCVEQVDD